MAGKARDLLVRFLGDDSDLRKTTRSAADDVEGTLGKVEAKADSPKLGGLKGKLGGIFDDLVAKVPGADKALGIVGKSGDDLADKLGSGIGSGAAMAGAAVAAFALDGAQEFVSLAKEAKNLATTMGSGSEEASRWLEVLRPLGVELGDTQDIFGNMAQLVQANDAAFAQLGVTVARNADGTVDMNETMIRSVEALGKVKDGSERAALAQKLFGEQGSRQLTPLIDHATELRKRLDDVADGLVMTEEQTASAEKLDAGFQKLSGTIRGVKLELGKGLVPALLEFSDAAQDLDKAAKPIGGLATVSRLWADTLLVPVRGIAALGQAATEVGKGIGWLSEQITHNKREARDLAAAHEAAAAAASKSKVEHAELSSTLGTGAAASLQMAKATAEKNDVAKADAAATAAADRRAREFKETLDAQAKAQERARLAFEEHVTAVRSSFDAQAAFRESERQLAEATDEAAAAVEAAGQAKMRDQGRNVEAGRKMDDLKAKVLDTAEAYGRENGALDGSREATDRQISKLGELKREYATRLPEIAEFIGAYIEDLKRAALEADRAARAVKGFELNYASRNGEGEAVVRLATGGVVRARPGGTQALLAEAGVDEAVIPLAGGAVPVEISGAVGAGPAGQMIFAPTINVAGSVWHVEDLVDAITPAIQRRMRFTNGQLFSSS